MDQFKNLLNCSLCNEILVSPVTIACGNNVCKRHLDQILESLSNSEKQSFECQLCHNVHSLSINDLIINKQIQNILDTEFYKMKININCFEECKQTLEDTNETFSMFESISKDPESHIYEYFQEIKNKVDIRREELKAKIDTYSDDILKSIDLKRLSCIKLSSNFNQTASEIEQLKKELDELFKQFNNFEINQNKYETLKRNADILKDKFAQKVIVYKESLILNKDYSFVCKDTSIEDIFGRLDLKDTSSDVTETSVKKDAVQKIWKMQNIPGKHDMTRNQYFKKPSEFSDEWVEIYNGKIIFRFMQMKESSNSVLVLKSTDRFNLFLKITDSACYWGPIVNFLPSNWGYKKIEDGSWVNDKND